MKKILTGLFAVLAFTVFFAVAEAKASDDIGFTVGVDYWSTYLWRGQYITGDQQGWFFPNASFEVIEGLTIGVEGWVNAGWFGTKSEEPKYNGDQKYENAIGAGIDYSYTMEGLLTANAGAWYFRPKQSFFSYATAYVGADFHMVPFVTPLVKVSVDYYTGNKLEGEKYKEYSEGSSDRADFYIQAGFKKEIEISKDAGIDFGALAGYAIYRALGYKINDISDIDLFINATVNYGAVTFVGGLHYLIVPGTQFKYGGIARGDVPNNTAIEPEKDIHRFFATFGASYSL